MVAVSRDYREGEGEPWLVAERCLAMSRTVLRAATASINRITVVCPKVARLRLSVVDDRAAR